MVNGGNFTNNRVFATGVVPLILRPNRSYTYAKTLSFNAGVSYKAICIEVNSSGDIIISELNSGLNVYTAFLAGAPNDGYVPLLIGSLKSPS